MKRNQKKSFLTRLVPPVTVATVMLLIFTIYNHSQLDSRRFGPYADIFSSFKAHCNDSNCTGSWQKLITNTGAVHKHLESNQTVLILESITSRQRLTEVRHVAFLKVHKCASSTVLNVLYRFGLKRNLNFVLPLTGNYIRFGQRAGIGAITEVPPPIQSDYDILCNHVYYFSKDNFVRYLPSDTVYLAIVRHPFQRMQSAFNYYRNIQKFKHLRKVGGSDPFQTYLSRQDFYEFQWAGNSVTNNKMARDFGFPMSEFRNTTKFISYLAELDKTFDLVLVTEMFEESLVLARRLLNWSMRDIVFMSQNAHAYKSQVVTDVRKRAKPYLALDYMLYEHFLYKLKQRILSQGEGFYDELSYFQSVNAKTGTFCKSSQETKMTFSATRWHETFVLSKQDCNLMKKTELQFLKLLRDTQVEKLKRIGANVTKLLK